jgi:diaminopimelate epimerase
MKFTKMQGCGNDFVLMNGFEETENRAALAVRVSDRHFGVGSDGLLFLDPSDVADFRMDMYNADGSRAEMCGNGIRCLGKFAFDKGLTEKKTVTVETDAGIKTLWLHPEGGKVKSATVAMGAPEFRPAFIPVAAPGDDFALQPLRIAGTEWLVTAVSVGNPHAVVFVEDPDELDLPALGPLFENHLLFPERVNTEFVSILDAHTLKMRVWERGCGETLACGTGATAALAAAAYTDRADNAARVILPGGELKIEWNRREDLLYMTGPVVTVFEGELE